MNERNYDLESLDTEERKYNYEFDLIAREIFLERVAGQISTGKESRSLEVGSFDGSMTQLILKYVQNLTVVEPSADLASRVENLIGERVSVEVSTIENFSTIDRFDNIFLVHTLEHVDDPVMVLKKLKSLLNVSGKLFVMVPNGNALSRQIAVKMGLIRHKSAVTSGEASQGHIRTYTMDTLLADSADAGLTNIEFGGVIVKALANFQFDLALEHKIVDMHYFRAADELARLYPDLSASIYLVSS